VTDVIDPTHALTPPAAAALLAANQLLRQGRWAQALQAYDDLLAAAPQLGPMLAPNLALARQRLGSAAPPAPSPSKSPAPPPLVAPPALPLAPPARRAAPVPPAPVASPVPPLVPRADPAPALVATAGQATTLVDLYRHVDRVTGGRPPAFDKLQAPLVSVLVTSHNTEDYVEACLESLLSQSYPNVEILVIDDASRDATPDIVRRVARGNGRIRLLQLNANLGTYYAKNLGILRARGAVMFFQDSDDICHPHRLALQMDLLRQQPAAQIVRGAYSRVDPDTGRVIPVNGLLSKLGLITLGVRRDVFQQIGYFNCTTKASDDEFFNRAVRYLGRGAVVNQDLPLYYNTMREGSLFADMVHWNADGSIEQKPSPARQAYVESYRAAHAEPQPARARARFAFPRIRDALDVYPEMSKLANPEVPVVVSVCSIPAREAKLERALRSIAPQCDRLHVYLDRYEHEPAFLQRLGVPVTVVRSQARPGLRDNGKFIALEALLRAGEDAYYFTIDDDIEYPADYVNALVKTLKAHEDGVVAGVHGVTLKDRPAGYFSDRRMVHAFTRALERPRLVNVLGTGTTAFRASLFEGFSLAQFEQAGMADLYLAVDCLRRGIPQLCVARPEGWLQDLGDEEEISLYTEFKGDDRLQSRLLQAHGPWGLSAVAATVDALTERRPALHATLKPLLPTLRAVTMPAAP
jgi:glycosyltransferase involved in cell wall biosynthesis